MQRVLREIRPTLTLAVPIILGQVSQMLMGVTDSLMIGHTGAVPLAASSFGGSVFGLFYVVGIGLTIPVGLMVSHARGAGRPAEIGEYLRHGLALSLLFGLVETLMMGLLATQLHRFGQPADVLAAINPFFLIIGASIMPVLVYLALRQFAEAMGRPWVPTVIMLASVALNVLLNWMLIYGNLGAPALGLTGAGLATLLSRVAATVVLWNWIHRDPALRLALPRRWLAPVSLARVREMLRLGVPTCGMLLFESGAFSAAAVMMGWLGTVPLAAHQIALSCVSTTFMFVLGLSTAGAMRLSAAVGAGERARCRPVGAATFLMGLAIAGFFMVVYAAGRHEIPRWFVDDAAVIQSAAQLFLMAAVFQLADGAQVIGAAALRSLNDVRVPVLITLGAYWGLAIPAGYLVGVRGDLGGTGIWGALAAGLAVAAVLLARRFHRLTA